MATIKLSSRSSRSMAASSTIYKKTMEMHLRRQYQKEPHINIQTISLTRFEWP